MQHRFTTHWDENSWLSAEPIYRGAFPKHGRKSRALIERMFQRNLCALHTWMTEDDEVVAMALTAYDAGARAMLIDYLAVSRNKRGQGIGLACVADLSEWAAAAHAECRGLIIEVEADESDTNAERISFWLRAGFRLTDYVHAYIWVPETYRAMYLPFNDGLLEPSDDGKTLFAAITRYHERAYRGGDLPEE